MTRRSESGLRNFVFAVRDRWRILMFARISIALVLLGLAILSLEQGTDAVRTLVDGANLLPHLPPGEKRWLLVQWGAFLFSCLWTGLNAWYWPLLIFKLTERSAPSWFLWLSRVLGVLPVLAATLTIQKIERTSASASQARWPLICFSLATLALAAFLLTRNRLFVAGRFRRGWYGRTSVVLNGLRRVLGSGPLRGLTKGDDAFFLVTLGGGLLLLLVLCVPLVRTRVAWSLGPPALAFGSFGIIIAMLSAAAFAASRLKIPVVSLLGLAFLSFSCTNDNHGIRDLGQDFAEDRPDLDAALGAWEGSAGDGPIVLVAASGGASRAGYWVGAVLRDLDDLTDGKFATRLFAVSAVSGGALGALEYAAWHADHPASRGCTYGPGDQPARLAFDRAFLGADYLGPDFGALLYPDLVQRFVPLPIFPDRAEALEEAWEIGWREAASRPDVALPHCPPSAGSDRMAQEFRAIWSSSALKGHAGWVPLVLVNGTVVENGKRIVTAPIRIESGVFEDSYDFYSQFRKPIRASTAIMNGARFPVISPAGTLNTVSGPRGRIVDGGYFENGGLETLIDLAQYISRTPVGARHPIILIEIANDVPGRVAGEQATADLDRHGNSEALPAGHLSPLTVQPLSRGGAPILSEITSILGGLYSPRTSRGVLGAKRLSTLSGIKAAQGSKRYTFNLFRLSPAGEAMSWSLSPSSRDRMDQALSPRSIATGGVDPTRAEAARDQVRHGPDNACQVSAAGLIASAIDKLVRAPVPGCTNMLVARAVGVR